jgi:hypothetical protein
LLVLISIGCLLVAIVGYKANLEQDGLEFSSNVFQHVFIDHDSEYLVANSNPDKHRRNPEVQAAAFVAQTSQLGPLKAPPSFRSALVLRYMSGHLRAFDHLFGPTEFEAGTVFIDLRISQNENGWGVDHLDWNW